jgi:hypothetical protein
LQRRSPANLSPQRRYRYRPFGLSSGRRHDLRQAFQPAFAPGMHGAKDLPQRSSSPDLRNVDDRILETAFSERKTEENG